MADFYPASQTDWAAKWRKFQFNKNGNLILPDHLENTVRTTLACQLSYSKYTPAMQSLEFFISSFMIELHNRLGRFRLLYSKTSVAHISICYTGNDPLVNWVHSTPHYQQPGAALIEYKALKRAARDRLLNSTEIVALVLTNGQSKSLPQAKSAVESPAEGLHAVADHYAGTASMGPSEAPTYTMREEDATSQENAISNEKTCANCHRSGHELRDCIGPVDAQGWLVGCPYHNETRHLYHDCDRRLGLTAEKRAQEDEDFLLYYRQNKPPIKCTVDWTELYNERHPPLISLPWTPAFALEQSKATGVRGQWGVGISCELYPYEFVDNPDMEARHRMKDPATDDLSKKALAMPGVFWDPKDESEA